MAVYTDVTLSDLKSFLGEYDVGIVSSYEGIAQGQENTNYHLRVKKKRSTPVNKLYTNDL